jgi:ADP-ribose pyrophosphatase YjhB (NUDIX family)
MGISVVLKSKGKFLLQLRDNKKWIKNPNKWSLFGGGIKNGESSKEAAIRERKEELELDLKERDLLLISKTKFRKVPHYNFLLKKDILISKLNLQEGQAMKLFSRKEIIWMKKVTFETKLFFLFHKL